MNSVTGSTNPPIGVSRVADATMPPPVKDLAHAGAVDSLMRRIDNLVALAANPHACDGLRAVERCKLREAVERELITARQLGVR